MIKLFFSSFFLVLSLKATEKKLDSCRLLFVNGIKFFISSLVSEVDEATNNNYDDTHTKNTHFA